MPPKATSTGLAELTMTISIPRTAILSVLPTNLLNFKLIFLQAIMRAFMSGWTGRRLNEANMTVSGEK